MEETDRAYLAGIIDGEGSFIIVKHENNTSRGWNYEPCVSVSNTNKKLLDWIQLTFMIGSVWSKDYKKRKKKHKLPWVWQLYDMVNIIGLVNIISPYLIVKKQQALLLGEFCVERIKQFIDWDRERDDKGRFIKSELGYSDRQHEIFHKLRELNHR